MTIVIFIDGVLRSHTGTPIYQGLGLYRLFNDNNRVILLGEHRGKDDIWLRQHKINKLDDLIDHTIPGMTDFPEWRQVEYLRGNGPVDLVITSDPKVAKKLLEVGITTMVFMQPSYVKEEFRPDSRVGAKTWEDIDNEITRQIEAIIEDPRLNK